MFTIISKARSTTGTPRYSLIIVNFPHPCLAHFNIHTTAVEHPAPTPIPIVRIGDPIAYLHLRPFGFLQPIIPSLRHLLILYVDKTLGTLNNLLNRAQCTSSLSTHQAVAFLDSSSHARVHSPADIIPRGPPLVIPWHFSRSVHLSCIICSITMKQLSLIGLACLSSTTEAKFYGLGNSFTNPTGPCAFACRASIASAPLACSGTGDGGGHSHGAPPTSPQCRGNDSAFLTTLAFCIDQKCRPEGVQVATLEKYWALQTTGDPSVQPKWGYTEALMQVTAKPNSTYQYGEMLNSTLSVSEETYGMQATFMAVFDRVTARESQYTSVLHPTHYNHSLIAS